MTVTAPTSVKDVFGRLLQDLRISVTDRCNFRCSYCMPAEIFGERYEFLPRDQILTFEEIERLTRIFAGLGVTKIRVTGGEPLLRRDLPELIRKLWFRLSRCSAPSIQRFAASMMCAVER